VAGREGEEAGRVLPGASLDLNAVDLQKSVGQVSETRRVLMSASLVAEEVLDRREQSGMLVARGGALPPEAAPHANGHDGQNPGEPNQGKPDQVEPLHVDPNHVEAVLSSAIARVEAMTDEL